jgi:hypothetical protein
MSRILGHKIGLFAEVALSEGTLPVRRVIGLSTSCSLDVDAEVVELAAKGRGRRNRTRRYGYTLTVECLFDAGGMQRVLARSLKEGTELPWVMAEGIGAEVAHYSGVAVVSRYNMTAPVNGYATASVTLTGTAELEIY